MADAPPSKLDRLVDRQHAVVGDSGDLEAIEWSQQWSELEPDNE